MYIRGAPMSYRTDRELFLFFAISGICLISLVAKAAGELIQGTELGMILFFVPPAVLSWWLQ